MPDGDKGSPQRQKDSERGSQPSTGCCVGFAVVVSAFFLAVVAPYFGDVSGPVGFLLYAAIAGFIFYVVRYYIPGFIRKVNDLIDGRLLAWSFLIYLGLQVACTGGLLWFGECSHRCAWRIRFVVGTGCFLGPAVAGAVSGAFTSSSFISSFGNVYAVFFLCTAIIASFVFYGGLAYTVLFIIFRTDKMRRLLRKTAKAIFHR